MKIKLLAPAATELEQAVSWDAAQTPDVAEKFLAEIEAAGILLATVFTVFDSLVFPTASCTPWITTK